MPHGEEGGRVVAQCIRDPGPASGATRALVDWWATQGVGSMTQWPNHMRKTWQTPERVA